MIALEAKEQKYNKVAHAKRLDRIIEKWEDILRIIDEELPTSEEIKTLLIQIGAPISPEEIGLEQGIIPMTFLTTKDIRDKYVLSRLFWDLGIMEELV
jgi:glycerol-1-phosphate dehydrogenase [NAD(P)+]